MEYKKHAKEFRLNHNDVIVNKHQLAGHFQKPFLMILHTLSLSVSKDMIENENKWGNFYTRTNIITKN